MQKISSICFPCLIALLIALPAGLFGADSFTIVSYNAENYLDRAVGNRKAKPATARAKLRECVLAVEPDVLALQEMGARSALLELQTSLKAEGLDLPHLEHVSGWDTNIHVAVLSRFPIDSPATTYRGALCSCLGRRCTWGAALRRSRFA